MAGPYLTDISPICHLSLTSVPSLFLLLAAGPLVENFISWPGLD